AGREPRDPTLDRGVRAGRAASRLAGRRYVEPAARCRHLAQRQEALVPRGAARDPRRAGRAMRGRLNLFQSAMLRWRDLHPYSAVHVVRVPVPLDGEWLKAAIEDQLAFAGLAGLVLDRRRRRYEYRGGKPTFELTIVDDAPPERSTLCGEIERQLNRPFPADGRIDPFRFFVLPEAGAFRFGLAYDHFIAGGDSIVALKIGRA